MFLGFPVSSFSCTTVTVGGTAPAKIRNTCSEAIVMGDADVTQGRAIAYHAQGPAFHPQPSHPPN